MNGEVYLWGNNELNQMGIDSNSLVIPVPTLVKGLSGVRVKSLAIGGQHSFAIDEEQKVYGWGSNHEQQLGVKDAEMIPVPQIIPCLESRNIAKIGCSNFHTVCISGLLFSYIVNEFLLK